MSILGGLLVGGECAPRLVVRALSAADFDAALRRVPDFEAALLRAGFRNPAGVPLRAVKKFVALFGDFGLTERERRVVEPLCLFGAQIKAHCAHSKMRSNAQEKSV